jgi:hypothetical protein
MNKIINPDGSKAKYKVKELKDKTAADVAKEKEAAKPKKKAGKK